MAEVLHVFDLMEGQWPKTKSGTFAIFGNDWFLRHRAIDKVVEHTGVDQDAVRARNGDETGWREVHDDLASRSLFDDTGNRLTILNSADGFVTKHRTQLERWAETTGDDATLVLEVDSFPANTKLYKLILEHGTIIRCSPPIKARTKDTVDEKGVQAWILSWGKRQHSIQLSVPQANVMIERIGFIFGLLDTELAKLALFAGEDGKVSDAIVHDLVGGWRTKTVWEVADQIAEGHVSQAMEQLDRLFASGQNAIGIFAQLSWYFRRFGMAAHCIEQAERYGKRPVIGEALEQSGFHRYAVGDAEKKLRRIGRERAKKLLPWLRKMDLELKGTHSQESRARGAVEEFVLRFA
jgi:DNA polymerase III subunit delta